MELDNKNTISIIDANNDFSKVTNIAETYGQAVILKDNRPKYVLLDVDQNPQIEMSDDEKIEYLGKKILREHIGAFKELAK